MTLDSLSAENFFSHHALQDTQGLNFEDILSPDDGVVYPGISIAVSKRIEAETIFNFQRIFQAPINLRRAFFRLSLPGMDAPHQAHTDLIMGTYTALVYLTPDEFVPEGAGTSLLEHKNGMRVTPRSPEEEAIWRRDTNSPQHWRVTGFCPMKFNRLFLINSDLFHRAEPIGGFGDGPLNGRLVFTAFFDIFY
jgi:hypothetical protein